MKNKQTTIIQKLLCMQGWATLKTHAKSVKKAIQAYHGAELTDLSLIVTCERCTTPFHLDPQKLTPQGANVRCAKCGYVFFVSPQADRPLSKDDTSDLKDPAVKKESLPDVKIPLEPVGAVISDEAKGLFKRKESIPIFKASPGLRPSLKTGERTLTPERNRVVRYSVTARQKVLRSLVLFSTLLVGLGLGFLSLGALQFPRTFPLFLQFGMSALQEGIGVLSYDGRIKTRAPFARILTVQGKVGNLTTSFHQGAVPLRLMIFTRQKEFLSQTYGQCCTQGLSPSEVATFSIDMEIPPTVEIGSYRVSVDHQDRLSENIAQ